MRRLANGTTTANGVRSAGSISLIRAVDVGAVEAPVEGDHLAVERIQGAQAEVAVLGQLGEADVAVVGAVEQRADRRSLEEDGGIVLGMQRSAAQRLHVQGPGESLVEHADRLARMPMVRIVNGMAVAIASNLGIHVGGKPLFDDVSFKLERRDRMTLSGRNGAGKSTLLRLLAGELSPDSGGVVLEKGARVALHDQRPPRDATMSLGDYVFSGRADVIELEAKLERLERSMSDGDHSAETMSAYSDAQARLDLAGGYRWRDQVLAVLAGLGFDRGQSERSLTTFSGGELTRASLARSLAAKPELLLLDEPTNHLDIPSLEWLEGYLTGLDAAVVLVAHDRWFLESVGTSVLELEAGRGRYFSGPWHAWRTEQAAREIALGKAIERQQAEIERMERFVERFRYKASKAKQAQSRVKQIERVKAGRGRPRPARHADPALLLSDPRAHRALRAEDGGRAPRGAGADPGRGRDAAGRAGRARRPRRARTDPARRP